MVIMNMCDNDQPEALGRDTEFLQIVKEYLLFTLGACVDQDETFPAFYQIYIGRSQANSMVFGHGYPPTRFLL